MTPKARLLTEQRRRSVLDLVDQDGQVTVVDMVRRFSISAVTVRNDLDALAAIGAVVRSHGGAVRSLGRNRSRLNCSHANISYCFFFFSKNTLSSLSLICRGVSVR